MHSCSSSSLGYLILYNFHIRVLSLMISCALLDNSLNWYIELSSFFTAKHDLMSYRDSSLYNILMSWLESENSSFKSVNLCELINSSFQYSIGSANILVSITESTNANTWADVALSNGYLLHMANMPPLLTFSATVKSLGEINAASTSFNKSCASVFHILKKQK